MELLVDRSLARGQDKAIFFDLPFLPLVQALQPKLPNIKAWVCMADEKSMPAAGAGAGADGDVLNYEALVNGKKVRL